MVLLFINGVIGAGIFGLPSKAFELAGVYSIPALLVCSVAVFIIVLCFAEVSGRFDKTGGPYLYALNSFGPFPAFLTGWLLLLTRFITFAALINLLVTYLSVFLTWFSLSSSRIISILTITSLLAFINHIGIKSTTRVNNLLTIIKLLPLLLFIVTGFFFIETKNFEITHTPGFNSFSSTVLLLVFAFGGFESILVNSGEVKTPEKNLPLALITAGLIITFIYIMIQIITIGTLPTLAASEKPLAEAGGLFIGNYGAVIISAGAVFSVMGTLNAIMLVGSRLPFALSQENQFPKLFSFIHPLYKTPTWSLILFTAVTIIISLNYSFLTAASISAITRLIIYGIVCFALIKLRKNNKEQTEFFKLPYGQVIAIIGILITIWLVSSSKLNELRDIVIALLAGAVIYLFLAKRTK
jgi:basic amino acid/polyamine antiporter, APA family